MNPQYMQQQLPIPNRPGTTQGGFQNIHLGPAKDGIMQNGPQSGFQQGAYKAASPPSLQTPPSQVMLCIHVYVLPCLNCSLVSAQ